jgi:hypothetical protein
MSKRQKNIQYLKSYLTISHLLGVFKFFYKNEIKQGD